MTADKDFKKHVRSGALPGEGYAAARARILRGGGRGDGGIPPPEATQVMRDGLTRAGLLGDMTDDEELDWSGGPPLFEEYIHWITRDLEREPGPNFAALWRKAAQEALRGDLLGCAAQLEKLLPILTACGWPPDDSQMPFEYDEEAAVGDLDGSVIVKRSRPGVDGWQEVRFQVGRTYDVIGGAHRGRLCTIVRLRDSFMPSHAWVRFHDNQRTGEVATDDLQEHLTPEELADPHRCQKCRGMREALPVLELSGPIRPHLVRALEKLVSELLRAQRVNAREGSMNTVKAALDEAFSRASSATSLMGRVFDRSGNQLNAELRSHLPVIFIGNREVCMTCDGLVQTGAGWMESIQNDELAETLAQVATMLVAAERYRQADDRKAIENMLEQALLQVRFAFDDVLHVPDAARSGAWRELLDKEGLSWPEPEKPAADDDDEP